MAIFYVTRRSYAKNNATLSFWGHMSTETEILPGRSLSPAAERMRRHRQRRRNGMRPLWIELRVTEIDALVRIGLLKAETRNDANAIREALYEYLDQTLGRAA
jgi:hypothetical protein